MDAARKGIITDELKAVAEKEHMLSLIHIFVPSLDEVNDIAEILLNAEKPLVICGGGVRYSEAGEALEMFCKSRCV